MEPPHQIPLNTVGATPTLLYALRANWENGASTLMDHSSVSKRIGDTDSDERSLGQRV